MDQYLHACSHLPFKKQGCGIAWLAPAPRAGDTFHECRAAFLDVFDQILFVEECSATIRESNAGMMPGGLNELCFISSLRKQGKLMLRQVILAQDLGVEFLQDANLPQQQLSVLHSFWKEGSDASLTLKQPSFQRFWEESSDRPDPKATCARYDESSHRMRFRSSLDELYACPGLSKKIQEETVACSTSYYSSVSTPRLTYGYSDLAVTLFGVSAGCLSLVETMFSARFGHGKLSGTSRGHCSCWC